GHANVKDASVLRRWPNFPTHRPFGPCVSWDDGFACTAPVGTFPANAWGLHDMHGNVREFVGPQTRFRGGSFNNGASEQRCATLGANNWPSDLADIVIGFRVLCEDLPSGLPPAQTP